MFQNLVSPAVGMYVGDDEPFIMKMTMAGPARCFPRGLDVMAVLGSERAYEILKREGDTEYEGKDTSYDKQLTELRKEFNAFEVADWNRNLYWAWLYALRPLLEEFGEGYLSFKERSRLESLEGILGRLIDISKGELEGRELKENDYEFIRNFGQELDSIVAGVEAEGKETTIVADVHTDTNQPRQVLEEGVGYVDLILAAYKVPDGRIILGAGPVFSYYEFKHPLGDRLTDEKWKEMLEQGKAPERPSWIESFYAE